MIKELYEAIDNLWANLAYTSYTENDSIKDRNLLIRAVERLESIDNANPSEALSRIEDCIYEDPYADRNDVSYENDIATIKQALLKSQEQEKVLEIIKEKKVDILLIKNKGNVNQYNEYIEDEDDRLTKEEFDLLKRYFK